VLLSFKNPGLRELCNSDKLLRKQFGEKGMKKIRQRLDELDAAENLAVIGLLPGPRCEELKGSRAGELSVRAHDGMRIIFRPMHVSAPLKPDGGLDWVAVTAIQILSIEDYHD
jgi:plasmid maintenance system killer protein